DAFERPQRGHRLGEACHASGVLEIEVSHRCCRQDLPRQGCLAALPRTDERHHPITSERASDLGQEGCTSNHCLTTYHENPKDNFPFSWYVPQNWAAPVAQTPYPGGSDP